MFNKVGSAAGIIGLMVTIFGWVGITPEMVGQTAYDLLYVAFPSLSGMFGIVAGWCLHGMLVDANAVKAAAVEAEKQKGETERERMRAEEADSIYLKGSHDLPNEGYSDLDAEDLISFVDTEVLEDGTRLTLKDDVKVIFNDHPEILEVVKEYCNREFASMMP